MKIASDLKKRFYNSKESSIEEFFEVFEAINSSKIQIIDSFDNSSDFLSKIENYKEIISSMKRARDTKVPLSSLISNDDLQFVKLFVLPISLENWAMEHLGKNRLESLWVSELCTQKVVLGYEVEVCLSLAKNERIEDSALVKNLKRKYLSSNDIYIAIENKVEEIKKGNPNVKIEEIFNKIQKVEVDFLDKNISYLAEILDYFVKNYEQEEFNNSSTRE